jgi:hypothetical protein
MGVQITDAGDEIRLAGRAPDRRCDPVTDGRRHLPRRAGVQCVRDRSADASRSSAPVAEDQATSVIHGMPEAAIGAGAIDEVAALGDIPAWLR